MCRLCDVTAWPGSASRVAIRPVRVGLWVRRRECWGAAFSGASRERDRSLNKVSTRGNIESLLLLEFLTNERAGSGDWECRNTVAGPPARPAPTHHHSAQLCCCCTKNQFWESTHDCLQYLFTIFVNKLYLFIYNTVFIQYFRKSWKFYIFQTFTWSFSILLLRSDSYVCS